jgi:acyl dehydratase
MSASLPSFEAIGGPHYEDVAIGDVFDTAPAVSLTDGLAATHAAIVGSRLHLSRDHELSRRVTGRIIAPPPLVWDVAIGQTTLVTQRAIANLFYRGLVLRTFPAIGDTLTTAATIVGKRPASPRPGRPPRGLVVMRITTADQNGRAILDFHRCAMLPAREESLEGGGELEPAESDLGPATLGAAFAGWDLAAFRSTVRGVHFPEMRTGTVQRIVGGDVVTCAPALARLTQNIAGIHHDRAAAADGRRLVYGGHTIGLAAAQISRAFPALVTIVGWRSCDHTGPVHEGDVLSSVVTVEERVALAGGGGLVHLRSKVQAVPDSGSASAPVLDWQLVALFA